MRVVDLVHRWTGGVLGLLLVVLGVSGTLLVHKDAWLRATVPHAADAPDHDAARLARTTARAFADPSAPRAILFAGESLGVHRLSYADRDAGAYLDRHGQFVTRWSGRWSRPEVWLFDLHHYLLIGPTGAIIAGWAAIAGLGFIITGALLWWRTRRLFRIRPWPKRWSRPALLWHHRDFGVVFAPLLLLTFVTGAAMTLKPVETLLVRPFASPQEIARATVPPPASAGPLARQDWAMMFDTARARFPTALLRSAALPAKSGDLITVRMRQPGEWTPNGRTFLWFDPSSGRLVGVRDVMSAGAGGSIPASFYPLHSGKAGGWMHRSLMTLSGLAVTMLGGFTTMSFWFLRRRGTHARMTT